MLFRMNGKKSIRTENINAAPLSEIPSAPKHLSTKTTYLTILAKKNSIPTAES